MGYACVCVGVHMYVQVFAGVCRCSQVCTSVHTCMWVCEWVCAGVSGCVRVCAVCAGVHGCVCGSAQVSALVCVG